MDDAALRLLLMAGTPSAQDPAFILKVLVRIERRRFRRGLIATTALAAGGAVVLGLLAPMLDNVGAAIARHADGVSLAITLSLAMLLLQRWITRDA